MKFLKLLWTIFTITNWCIGQVVDIGGVWEAKCPRSCHCQISKFIDLPLHRWIYPTNNDADQNDKFDEEQYFQEFINGEGPMPAELLKVATCVVTEDPQELLESLPSDLQVFTILEAGDGQTDIVLRAEDMQRFTDLISLNIQGMDNKVRLANAERTGGDGQQYRIILGADTLQPFSSTLRYLNLERITLTALSVSTNHRGNLVVEPAASNEDSLGSERNKKLTAKNTLTKRNGHRLIYLSYGADNSTGGIEDREILPYEVYKQEVEGQTVDVGMFTGLYTLTHLRAFECALKDVSWHMFDGLDNLVYLSLERNNLKFIPQFCFYGTPVLQFLNLASNQLLQMKSVDLAGLLALRQLDLSGNNLTFLSEHSFPPFPVLVDADFRGNPIDTVFPSTFEIMNSTTKLYLGGDGATLKLQKQAFVGLKLLEILHLYNLEIQLLERFMLQGMPSLRQLRISGNISRIDFDAFVDVKNLVDLDLSYCQLQTISMDAFYGLQRVKRIDLSNNNLQSIPPGLFSVQQQNELEEILLNGNKLTALPIDFFRNLRIPPRPSRIRNLRLDGNRWDCSCAMTFWNPNLVNRVKETAPRCVTPKRLENWGVFYALRKGRLGCRSSKRRNFSGNRKGKNLLGNDNNI